MYVLVWYKATVPDNLFTLVASLAGNQVLTSVTSDHKTIYGSAFEYLNDIISNFPSKSKAQDVFFLIFLLFSAKHGLHCSLKMEESQLRMFPLRFGQLDILHSLVRLQILLKDITFGFKIWEAYFDAKYYINNQMNNLFVQPHKVKSRRRNESD